MKRIYTLEDACIGCHLCEVACITEHSESKDPVKAYLHEPLRPISRCTVEEWDGGVVSLSTTCRHCDEPDCLRACISGAIRKNDAGSRPHRHRTVRRLLVMRHGLPLRRGPEKPRQEEGQ